MARALFCSKLFKTFKKKQAEDPPFGGPKLSFEFEKPSQVDGAREFGIRDQPTRGRRDREQQLVTLQVARCLYMLGASTLKSPGRLKKPKRVLSVEKPMFSAKSSQQPREALFCPRDPHHSARSTDHPTRKATNLHRSRLGGGPQRRRQRPLFAILSQGSEEQTSHWPGPPLKKFQLFC